MPYSFNNAIITTMPVLLFPSIKGWFIIKLSATAAALSNGEDTILHRQKFEKGGQLLIQVNLYPEYPMSPRNL
jgi:hypothetical protein